MDAVTEVLLEQLVLHNHDVCKFYFTKFHFTDTDRTRVVDSIHGVLYPVMLC